MAYRVVRQGDATRFLRMSAYQDLRKAIEKEVSPHHGVTLSWRTSPRCGEAIITRNGLERRVVFPRSPTRYDKANTIGRIRRSLRHVGVDLAPPVVRSVVDQKKKRPTQADRIAGLESRLNDALARIEVLEREIRSGVPHYPRALTGARFT